MKRLFAHQEICSGCLACEVACVAHHEGRFGLETARIKVSKIEPLGVDHPNVCRLCRRAPCVAACPSDALYKDGITGAVLILEDECIDCAECVESCPFGVVTMHPGTGKVLICDLCGGDPVCVKRCATGAIVYQSAENRTADRRRALAFEAWEEKKTTQGEGMNE